MAEAKPAAAALEIGEPSTDDAVIAVAPSPAAPAGILALGRTDKSSTHGW